jgi:hypothetical protein
MSRGQDRRRTLALDAGPSRRTRSEQAQRDRGHLRLLHELKVVESWPLDTDADGAASQKIKAAKPGQYRLSYKVTDVKQNTIEGGYLFFGRWCNRHVFERCFHDGSRSELAGLAPIESGSSCI